MIPESRFGVLNNMSFHLKYLIFPPYVVHLILKFNCFYRFGNGNDSMNRFIKFYYYILNLSGGVVEWVPCSHVAHIYRGPRTESQHPPGANPHQSSIVSHFANSCFIYNHLFISYN
jgi:hypothetical protein